MILLILGLRTTHTHTHTVCTQVEKYPHGRDTDRLIPPQRISELQARIQSARLEAAVGAAVSELLETMPRQPLLVLAQVLAIYIYHYSNLFCITFFIPVLNYCVSELLETMTSHPL